VSPGTDEIDAIEPRKDVRSGGIDALGGADDIFSADTAARNAIASAQASEHLVFHTSHDACCGFNRWIHALAHRDMT